MDTIPSSSSLYLLAYSTPSVHCSRLSSPRRPTPTSNRASAHIVPHRIQGNGGGSPVGEQSEHPDLVLKYFRNLASAHGSPGVCVLGIQDPGIWQTNATECSAMTGGRGRAATVIMTRPCFGAQLTLGSPPSHQARRRPVLDDAVDVGCGWSEVVDSGDKVG